MRVLPLATASAKDFEHTSLQGHSKMPVLGLRLLGSGRGTKYPMKIEKNASSLLVSILFDFHEALKALPRPSKPMYRCV